MLAAPSTQAESPPRPSSETLLQVRATHDCSTAYSQLGRDGVPASLVTSPNVSVGAAAAGGRWSATSVVSQVSSPSEHRSSGGGIWSPIYNFLSDCNLDGSFHFNVEAATSVSFPHAAGVGGSMNYLHRLEPCRAHRLLPLQNGHGRRGNVGSPHQLPPSWFKAGACKLPRAK